MIRLLWAGLAKYMIFMMQRYNMLEYVQVLSILGLTLGLSARDISFGVLLKCISMTAQHHRLESTVFS